jgi:hypothetical protein
MANDIGNISKSLKDVDLNLHNIKSYFSDNFKIMYKNENKVSISFLFKLCAINHPKDKNY